MSNDADRSGQVQSLKGASLRHSRRRRHVLIGTACACAAIVAVAVTVNTTPPWLSSKQVQSVDIHEARLGTIEIQTGQEQCDLLKFDNDTGRTINDSKRCRSDVMLDAHGIPFPKGTAHRLNSISKSFLGDGH